MKRVVFSLFLSAFPLATAHAQVSSNFGGPNGGAVIIGESTTTCDASIQGAIRYDSGDSKMIDYCDGVSWKSLTNSGSGSSMLPGWPDAINCRWDDNGTWRPLIYYVRAVGNDSPNLFVAYVADDGGGNITQISFNASDGSWYGGTDPDDLECNGK